MDFATLAAVLVLTAFWIGVVFFALSLRRLEQAVARMEAATKVVAENLASAGQRADASDIAGPPGTAADASARTQ